MDQNKLLFFIAIPSNSLIVELLEAIRAGKTTETKLILTTDIEKIKTIHSTINDFFCFFSDVSSTSVLSFSFFSLVFFSLMKQPNGMV